MDLVSVLEEIFARPTSQNTIELITVQMCIALETRNPKVTSDKN